ncbi:selenide,water dikinase [Desulfohalotomaculum tongense]|nr:selenide,water dikinase [Desulforadius tongensis]
MLRQLPKIDDPNLMVGLENSDDAAVYRITDDTAIIQTLDFFPPMVDDPYIFGQIAAANALSDVYAMGGRPVMALNIVCFPNCLDTAVLEEILRGGADKVSEAGAVIAGGHSVEDDEPKYGLAVTGLVHPDRMLSNGGALPGDVLVLTKPLGTGIVNTAVKGNLASQETSSLAVKYMAMLNNKAGQVMNKVGVNACTDITGFGLLGHAAEMARASNAAMEFWSSECPVIPGVIELAQMGMIPAGAYNNRQHLGDGVTFADSVPREMQDIMFDPQTSGGLLISVPEHKADRLLNLLKESQVDAVTVGRVTSGGGQLIKVK